MTDPAVVSPTCEHAMKISHVGVTYCGKPSEFAYSLHIAFASAGGLYVALCAAHAEHLRSQSLAGSISFKPISEITADAR